MPAIAASQLSMPIDFLPFYFADDVIFFMLLRPFSSMFSLFMADASRTMAMATR